MPRKPKIIPGPSRLSGILKELNRAPRLDLSGLKALRLTLAARNDHFGARHFTKEELPRIRYANPALEVNINKLPKTKDDALKPEMVLVYENGTEETLNMEHKWSTTILKELMDKAGSPSWTRWKAEAAAAGLPVVPGEENERIIGQKPKSSTPSNPLLSSSVVSKPELPLEPKIGISAALP